MFLFKNLFQRFVKAYVKPFRKDLQNKESFIKSFKKICKSFHNLNKVLQNLQ